MALYILLPLSLATFLFFHYFVTPRAKKLKSDNRWVTKFGKPALLAVLKYTYTFFFLAALTYALLGLVAFVVGLSGASTAAGFESAIARVQAYRDALKVFKSYWGLAVFIFIFMAVTTILYRRLRDAIRAEVEQEKRRLERGRETGEWESFEPTAEMREVAKKIHDAQVLFDGLDPLAFCQTKESQDARMELKEKIKGLRARWHDLDLERRAYLNLEEQQRGGASSSPRKESWARSFFGSKGFLGVLQSVSRATGHVGLILLFLSLVGVNTPIFDRALAQSLVRLTDLQVRANQKEARESFAKLMSREEDGGERDRKRRTRRHSATWRAISSGRSLRLMSGPTPSSTTATLTGYGKTSSGTGLSSFTGRVLLTGPTRRMMTAAARTTKGGRGRTIKGLGQAAPTVTAGAANRTPRAGRTHPAGRPRELAYVAPGLTRLL
jgi:cbb3-type cytochrome oxidase subunit 3